MRQRGFRGWSLATATSAKPWSITQKWPLCPPPGRPGWAARSSPEIPLPAIAEVQQALAQAASAVTGMDAEALKPRLRTGTVVTTDDRNWELHYASSAKRFSQSRAIAVEMESATIAAQGYRFRVPYGTLLCVSDKPLHGEIKLPGQANKFYEEAIAAHLQIGLEAVARLRDEGDRLHSRKLRAFNEPPFR